MGIQYFTDGQVIELRGWAVQLENVAGSTGSYLNKDEIKEVNDVAASIRLAIGDGVKPNWP